jgi:D-glycero-D-manno-heptose 1,7-bisphosphate phosphatase
MRPAVFLDRDDTLIECRWLPPPAPPARPGDLIDPALVRPLPGVAGALSALASAGLALVVVSNQGVVARGGATLEQVEAVNERLRQAIIEAGGPGLDAVYFCPYHPEGSVPRFSREHPWRKPAPGMILAAAAELALDLSRSWLVGDAERDVQAGLAAGLPTERCLLIGEGGAYADLVSAAEAIVSALAGPGVVRGQAVSSFVLRAMEEGALRDPRVRDTVLATARALADRAGLRLAAADADDGSIRFDLACDRLAGMGFVAELRRATNAWHVGRTGSALWPGEGEELRGA